jgi:hypothetical protein
MLDNFGTGKTAVALLRWHLVNLAQLLHQALLIGWGQAAEVGVAAQQLLLILERDVAVVIEPVFKVAGRGKVLAHLGIVRR